MKEILFVLILVLPFFSFSAPSEGPKPTSCDETIDGSVKKIDQAQRIRFLGLVKLLLVQEPKDLDRLQKALLRLTKSLESGALRNSDDVFDLMDRLIEMEQWSLASHLGQVLYRVAPPRSLEQKRALLHLYEILWHTQPKVALQKVEQNLGKSASTPNVLKALDFSARAIRRFAGTKELAMMIPHLLAISRHVTRLPVAGNPPKITFVNGKESWDAVLSEKMGRVVALARLQPDLQDLVGEYTDFAMRALSSGFLQSEFLIFSLAPGPDLESTIALARAQIKLIPDHAARVQLSRLLTEKIRDVKLILEVGGAEEEAFRIDAADSK